MKINEYIFDHDILVASNYHSSCKGQFYMSGLIKYFATASSFWSLNTSRNG